MIKALIVEDEVLARLGLHQLMDWKALGYTLLEDAKDGLEALEIIEREHPQVLLLDLNLPKANGLQIQKYLVEHQLNCRIIVISCNEDFTVIKESLKLGAYDFLRKLNLTSEELTHVLVQCRNEIETRKTVEPALRYVRRVLRYEEVSEHAESAAFDEGYDALLCLVAFGGTARQENFIALLSGWLEQRKAVYLLLTREQQPLILLLRREQGFQLQAFQKRLQELHGDDIYIGMCEGTVDGSRTFYRNTVLAEQILLPAYYDAAEHAAVYAERLPKCEKCPFDFNEDYRRFQAAVSVLSEEDLAFAVKTLFERIRAEEYIGLSVLRRMFMDLLGVYSAAAQALGGSLEEIEIDGQNCHYRTLMATESLSGVESWFQAFSAAFVERYYISYKTCQSDILRKTMRYIENHLYEPIQLGQAARSICVSEAYLSSLFKKEIGQNFISYVNRLKIEKAKELLSEGMLIYEASDRLGYENCTYFSKLFKRYSQMTPDAYRKQYGKDPASGDEPQGKHGEP